MAYVRTTPDGSFLYASSEIMDYESPDTIKQGNDACITAYSRDKETGKLTVINTVSSRGGACCHIDVDSSGQFLACSNYMGGTACLYKIREDGGLDFSSMITFDNTGGPNKERQEQSHPHSANFASSKGETIVLVPDLGNDCIH